MKVKSATAALAAMAVLWFAFAGPSLSCQARFSWDGKQSEQSAHGFLVYQEMSIDEPMIARVVLRGAGEFKFRFSPDVHWIRLSSSSNVFYEGVPIASHNGPPAALAIEMHRNGKTPATWLEVADSCSLPSLLRSFF